LVTYRRKQEKSYLKSRKYQKRLKDTTVAEELESEWKNEK